MTPQSPFRRFVFFGMTAALVLFILEFLSYAGLRWFKGEELKNIAAEQKAIAENPEIPEAALFKVPNFMKPQVIHPYLGYVYEEVTPNDPYGFRNSVSPLQKKLMRIKEAIRHFEFKELPYVATGPPEGKGDAQNYLGEAIAIWKRGSLLLQRLCAANGIRYFHFLQPNQYVPGSKKMSEEELKTVYQPQGEWGRAVARSYPLLIQEGQALIREGVFFEDLTKLFVADKETLYIDNCCHFNQKGNEQLAKAVAQFMEQHLE